MSAADRARGVVADWTLRLVRGLPERVARDRFDEIVSDLWEHQHAAEARGRSAVRIAASILLRALRGVPADLQWRWAAARRPAPSIEGISMTRKTTPAGKPWVPLTDVEKPFDQTNGAVDFDVEAAYDPSNPERDLLEKGVAMNAITFPGGGF